MIGEPHNYDRRTFLVKATLAGGLVGLVNCKSFNLTLDQVSLDIVESTSRTYEELIGRFMERTKARYVANEDGAVATFYQLDGAKMEIVDGHPEGLNLGQEAWLTVKSWFDDDIIKYDGVPDKVIITEGGVVSRYDHHTGVSSLPEAAAGLKQITADVGKYLKLFSIATINGDMTYEDYEKYGDASILATLGRTEILARAINSSRTDSLQVYRDSNKIIEITGIPKMFSKEMNYLMVNSKIMLANRRTQEILSQ